MTLRHEIAATLAPAIDARSPYAKVMIDQIVKLAEKSVRESCANLVDAVGQDWKDDGQSLKHEAAEYLADCLRIPLPSPPSECDCAADDIGMWADIHSPSCASFNSPKGQK